MNKRILILCEAIAPPAYSPRIITLVNYLQQHGWQCTIVTEMDNDTPLPNSEASISPQGIPYTIHQMPTYRHLVADKLFGAKELALAAFAEKQVDIVSVDLIFCASYYYFPLQAATRLARRYHKPLIIDLRDITEQWGKLDYYTRSLTGIRLIDNIAKRLYTCINHHQRNQALQQASAVTTVSPWHQQQLAQYNPATHLIYNGFDDSTFVPSDQRSERFDIMFIGKYYAHYHDCPKLLFAALRNLIVRGEMDRKLVGVHFYTNTLGQQGFAQLAQQYTLEDLVQVHDYIPRSELVNKMHQASILLVLTTSSKIHGTHGIMGTKFYEILGVEKPCLCLTSDDDCLAATIQQTNAGLAAHQVEEVEAFILDKYHEWLERGYTHQQVRNKEQFTRHYEAKQFEQLFIKTIGI